ncbi:MAG: hypothetical protein ACE1ZC_00240 [Nitrososphaerales archaeon]|jgi:hypothetical protein|nr:hypothetical protein [Nitrososphaerota archaeon]
MAKSFEQELVREGDYITIKIPADWSGAEDRTAQIIVDEVCVIVPESTANATGELLVLRLLESMISAGIISTDDVQKAIEHIV